MQKRFDFISNSGLAEVKIKTEEFELSIKKYAEGPQVVHAAPVAAAAPPAPAKPAGISRGVSEGEAGCKEPGYPREQEMAGEEGTVRMRLLVDSSGKVIDAKVKKSSGVRELDKAATKAYSLCSFTPAMKDGVPQQDWYEIEYTFKIS